MGSYTVYSVRPDRSRLAEDDWTQTLKSWPRDRLMTLQHVLPVADSGLGWGWIHRAMQSFTLTRCSVHFCSHSDLVRLAFACHRFSHKAFFVRFRVINLCVSSSNHSAVTTMKTHIRCKRFRRCRHRCARTIPVVSSLGMFCRYTKDNVFKLETIDWFGVLEDVLQLTASIVVKEILFWC